MRTTIILPTYNERENVVPLIRDIFATIAVDVRVLVVDDGSPDGTAEAVARAFARDGRVELLKRPRKDGIAAAYQAAFDRVLADGVDQFIVTMDADFSHDPRFLPVLLDGCRTHDVVVGSRYVDGGRIENWDWRRRLLSCLGNLYVRLVVGLPYRDCTTGFSAMRAAALRAIPYRDIRVTGYAWFFSLRTLFWRAGASIVEVPITFTQRRAGKSKLSSSIVYEGLIAPWALRFSGSHRRERSAAISGR